MNTLLSQDLNFVNINADMGLPSNECYRIAQDANGYIWIATESGLVKYNSRDFILFNTAKGMPSNGVYALAADKKGRLWFATGNWKVGYILNDTVHVLNDANFFNEELKKGDVIYKIQYNESSGSLFVSSHHQTIEVFVNEEKLNAIQLQNENGISDFLLLKKFDKPFIANLYNSNRRYLLSQSPVYLNVNQTDSVLLPINQQSVFFTEIFSINTKNEGIVIGLLNTVFELTKNNKIVNIQKLPSQIVSIINDYNGNVWVGCKGDGLYLFEKGNLSIKPKHYFQGLSVSNILEDHENGIWITTLERGVFYIPNTFVKRKDKNSDGFSSNKSFLKLVDNALWFSDNLNSLNRVNELEKDTFKIKNLGKETGSVVTDVISISNGYLISTLLGIYYTNLKQTKPLTLPTKALVASNKLIKLSPNKVIGYNNNVFYEIDCNKLSLVQITNDIKIAAAIKIKDFILYTGRSGLYTLNKNKISVILTPAAELTKNVNKLYEDSYGNIWLPASSDTLNILNSNFKLKKQIITREKNINCRNVLQINATNFLVSTNKGILQIIFSDTAFSNYKLQYYNKTNGLPSSDVYNIVKFKNNYYVNTSKGLCFFPEPENLTHQHYPNTVISSLTINDSIVPVASNATVAYNKNNVAFQIDALTYKKVTQRGVFFKYKLEGFDEEFKIATSNIVSYNNLSAGTYKFIAKAYYDDGTEDLTPAECSFTIRQPFWETWWGILFMGSAIMIIILLFLQWRIRKVKLAAAEKAAINKTIAEYKFTALKAQMNPHFVFNSINVIQNLILDKDKKEAYNALGKFSKLIRSILHQSDSVFATIEEEINLIDLYIELNQLRIKYPFIFKKEIQPKTLDYAIPSLIIQPFVENALWHGILPYKGEKEGVIYLRIFTTEENILTIEIEDNGIGRKASELKKPATSLHDSKGVELIQERLNAYKSMNNNNLAELRIIDLEENNEPTGTLVQLKISIVHEE